MARSYLVESADVQLRGPEGALGSLEPPMVPALQDEQWPETSSMIGATEAVLFEQPGDGLGPDETLPAQSCGF